MNQHDLACFEVWHDKFATEEEKLLSYEEQLERHILWLSGVNPDINLNDVIVTEEDRERPQ